MLPWTDRDEAAPPESSKTQAGVAAFVRIVVLNVETLTADHWTVLLFSWLCALYHGSRHQRHSLLVLCLTLTQKDARLGLRWYSINGTAGTE